MKLIKNSSPRKLEKLLSKEDFANKTILHYTGGMFGIGCTVSSAAAIERIIKLKQRPDNKGLIVLVPDIKWFADNDIHIPDRLHPLLEQYWPGNLTAVFKCDDARFQNVEVDGKVAFRVPNDDQLRFMIELFGEPLISTSVNIASLPPEMDVKRLTGYYESWFDYGFLPAPRDVDYDAQPSTIVEFIARNEAKNTSGSDELKCLREGSIPFYSVKKSFEMPTILFVCTANICRSPIAEKLFTHYAANQGLQIAGDSCGLLPGGEPISASSLQLLLEQGILEARDHVSKQVTPELLTGSKLILTMEQRHRDFLRDKEPSLSHKILTLNEYLGEEGDIEDPYGSGIDNYRKSYAIIDDRIKRLIAEQHRQGSAIQRKDI